MFSNTLTRSCSDRERFSAMACSCATVAAAEAASMADGPEADADGLAPLAASTETRALRQAHTRWWICCIIAHAAHQKAKYVALWCAETSNSNRGIPTCSP